MSEKLFQRVLFIIFIILLGILIEVKTYQHNMWECYKNINKIRVGDDIDKTLKIMDEGLFLRRRRIEKATDHWSEGADSMVVYPYKDDEATASYPRIYYNSKTGKVVGVSDGGFP